MTLSMLVKLIGWILAGIPLLIFLIFSINMVKGIAADDEQVQGMVSIFVAVFLIGVAILLFSYLTDYLTVLS